MIKEKIDKNKLNINLEFNPTLIITITPLKLLQIYSNSPITPSLTSHVSGHCLSVCQGLCCFWTTWGWAQAHQTLCKPKIIIARKFLTSVSKIKCSNWPTPPPLPAWWAPASLSQWHSGRLKEMYSNKNVWFTSVVWSVCLAQACPKHSMFLFRAYYFNVIEGKLIPSTSCWILNSHWTCSCTLALAGWGLYPLSPRR